MFAAVDLGSNSFRLHVAEPDGEALRVARSARDPVRLGSGLDSRGYLTDAAIDTGIESLRRFAGILGAYQLQAVRAVATNTLRVAKNAAAFLTQAERALGYPIDVISGEEEGRLIYLGVASHVARADERRLVLDIGGGSTELILGRGAETERVESFAIGTARQSLMFFPGGRIEEASFDAAILSARSQFEEAAALFAPEHWSQAYGSSGTVRAIAEVISRNGIGNGQLDLASLLALKQYLLQHGRLDAVALSGIKPERLPMMLGGLAILLGLMQELDMQTLQPVEAGLRFGVLRDLQLRATRRDRREQSVQAFLRRFGADPARAQRTADAAATLYRLLKPAADTYQKPLYWSALLHEVGLAVSQSSYHKHAAYLVENADLPGFTGREQRTMGQLVLAHKGNLRKLGAALAEADFAKAVLALRLAVMLTHARIPDEPDILRPRMQSRVELEIPRDWLAAHPTVSCWMRKEQEWWDEVDVDFTARVR